MGFYDLILIFSLYTIAFYHLVVGAVGIVTGSALVYPMPFTLNRPSLYLIVLWIAFLNQEQTELLPPVTHIISLILIGDLIFETVRPLLAPVITVIGTSRDEIYAAVREALSKSSVPFKGDGPTYTLLDPFGKLKVRFRRRLGTAEVRISPYRRKKLLEELSVHLAKRLDSKEAGDRAPLGYMEFVLVGVVLMGAAFWRVGVLLS